MASFKVINTAYFGSTIPDWQKEVVAKVVTECSQKVEESGKMLREAIGRIKSTDEYYGTAVLQAMREVPRYMYYKNCKDPDTGYEYDGEVDLIDRTVTFIRVK